MGICKNRNFSNFINYYYIYVALYLQNLWHIEISCTMNRGFLCKGTSCPSPGFHFFSSVFFMQGLFLCALCFCQNVYLQFIAFLWLAKHMLMPISYLVFQKKDDGASSSNDKEVAGKGCVSGVGTEAGSKNSTEGTAKLSRQEGRDTSTETTADGGAEGDGDMDQDLESGMDDKLWADVDKDLGELLREVVEPGNKSSDEDDDSRAEGGRYDRFRYSEKGSAATADTPSEGDANKTAAEADETVTKSDAGKGTKEVENAKSPGEDKQVVNDVPSAAATESN
jgi:hypothetical protein